MCQQYDKAVEVVLNHLVEHGFSRSVRKAFRHASREFAEYLDERHLAYSPAVASKWVNSFKGRVPRPRFLPLRRALALVEDAARNGTVTTVHFSYEDAPVKYRTPDCYKQLLDAYLERRRQDGNGQSALRMDCIACARFLSFLHSKDITDPSFITPEVVKDYHVRSQHRTPQGRNAYLRRIRGFIRFLASKNLVPQTLELAFALEKAPRVSIVTTLSQKQITSIESFGENCRSSSQLRSAAMAMLALRMGLRSVDICNLCFSNISWKARTISITQQKTGVPLTLPFPVEVGNLLARYILEGRPRCQEPNIFITLKRPYTRLTSEGCYHSSLTILGRKASAADVRGLHVARKTFASNLLRMGSPVSTISFALGHVDESSVDGYLATDGHRMRQCAIGLSGVELQEAFE